MVDVQLAVRPAADGASPGLGLFVLLARDAISAVALNIGRLASAVRAPLGVGSLQASRATTPEIERLSAEVAGGFGWSLTPCSTICHLAGVRAVLSPARSRLYGSPANHAGGAEFGPCVRERLDLARPKPLRIVRAAPAALTAWAVAPFDRAGPNVLLSKLGGQWIAVLRRTSGMSRAHALGAYRLVAPVDFAARAAVGAAVVLRRSRLALGHRLSTTPADADRRAVGLSCPVQTVVVGGAQPSAERGLVAIGLAARRLSHVELPISSATPRAGCRQCRGLFLSFSHHREGERRTLAE